MAAGPDPLRPGDTYTVIADASKERDRIKLRHNEQTKLTATVLNNVATAFTVGGGVAPFIAPFATAPTVAQIAWSAFWISVGIILHIGARLVLRSLQ